ncbi:MAG: MOSC domain-containing protein [Actinomycetota bacterium]
MPATETCDECGFDAAEYNQLDTLRTIDAAAALVMLWSEGMGEADRDTRPDPDTWSVNEYVEHLREVFFGMRMLVELARENPGQDLGPLPQPDRPGEQRRIADPVAAGAAFAEETTALAAALRATDDWAIGVTFDGDPHPIDWAARHAVHDLWHHLHDVARIRIALGDTVAPDTGSVAQVNASTGGVPKLPVDEAAVGRRGLIGDVQKARQHHGRPWQALCLWSTDVIDDLREEGHPIGPGSAGENLSLAGLDWAALRPGVVLEIGDVRCRISAYAVPCSKNAQWFADGDVNRIHQDRHPGWSRLYASVEQSGSVRPGDPVRVVG